MERLRSLREFTQRPFLESLRERVEQAPDIAFLKRLMLGFTPFMEYGPDETMAAYPDIRCSNDEVMGTGVGDVLLLVPAEANGLIVPLLQHPAHALLNKVRQITNDEPGVLSRQLHLAAEAEIVTNKTRCTCHHPSRECLVMRVPQTQHPAIIVVVVAVLDFQEAEIPLSFMTQAVGESPNGQVVGFDGTLDLRDELDVWDRCPRFGGPRRFHLLHISTLGEVCAAVKNEVGMMAFWFLGFEYLNHNDAPFDLMERNEGGHK